MVSLRPCYVVGGWSVPRRSEYARASLATLGIYQPLDVSAWARRHGMLSAFIEFIPATVFLPAHWRVVWPGSKTDSTGPAWQRGHKTFVVSTVREKNRAEDFARSWASARFSISDWVRIEGLGGCLFPVEVAEELKRYAPELVLSRRRQAHKKR